MRTAACWCGIVLAIWLAQSPLMAGQGGVYEYTFLANPNADNSSSPSPPDPTLDVRYVVRFDGGSVPAYNLSTLRNTALWTNRSIWLRMQFEELDVLFNEALDPASPTLAVIGGVVEVFPVMPEFLCVDFHPDTPFVIANNLPGDPFVFGQLDVYDNQQSFVDFFALWVSGDTSRLSFYAIPEPSLATAFLFTAALFGRCRAPRLPHSRAMASQH